MQEHGITQNELAEGIGRTQAYISRLANGEADPSKDTIDGILSFLSRRLRRRVTYEMVFTSNAPEQVA